MEVFLLNFLINYVGIKIYILCSHETNTLIKGPFSLLQHIINTNFQYFLLSKDSMAPK
jgi:hypothetical protein